VKGALGKSKGQRGNSVVRMFLGLRDEAPISHNISASSLVGRGTVDGGRTRGKESEVACGSRDVAVLKGEPEKQVNRGS